MPNRKDYQKIKNDPIKYATHLAKKREWAIKNKKPLTKEQKELLTKWRLKNKDKINARRRELREKNPASALKAKISQARWLLKNPNFYKDRHRKYDPLKDRARNKLFWAKSKGIVIPSKFCEDCKKVTRLQAHHEDYTKALEVKWLCWKCHSKADRLLRLNLTLVNKTGVKVQKSLKRSK